MTDYRILAVDDCMENLVLLKHFLSQPGNIEIIVFSDPLKALQCFQKDPNFDLVITDLSMPQLNGVEFLKALKNTREIKVIAITGKVDLDWENQGFDGYLLKPINFNKLAERIKAYLEPSQKPGKTSEKSYPSFY